MRHTWSRCCGRHPPTLRDPVTACVCVRRYGGAGAVWDIWARGADTDKLSGWLAGHAAEFIHQGKPVSVQFSAGDVTSHAPVMSQKFMLTEPHREQLFKDTGAWWGLGWWCGRGQQEACVDG